MIAPSSFAVGTPARQLQDKIADRTATIGIIGLGYVGLPLAMAFIKSGFSVIGYDVSERVVAALMSGTSHIQDIESSEVAAAVAAGTFRATTNPAAIAAMDAVSIAVPTPLGKTRDPDLSYVVSASKTVAAHAQPGTLVVLESTTYPGTTRELVVPEFTAKGLVVGETIFVAFSPERVDPGNPVWHTTNTPKVVGGVTPACVSLACALYGAAIDRVVPVSTTEAAELVKLLENTFRAINIGLVNEMAIICDRLGIDVWEVIDAAGTKPFGFMKFTPGPGIGGHCIPLDPHYLAWKMRALNYQTRFIDIASEINASMPEFVVRKTASALNRARKSVNGSRVLVLGVAYKKDIDDMRESPSLDVMRLLEQDGAIVEYHDPHVPTFREHGQVFTGVDLTAERLAAADAVIIVTDHSSVDYQFVATHAQLIIDTRNALKQVTPSATTTVEPLSGPVGLAVGV